MFLGCYAVYPSQRGMAPHNIIVYCKPALHLYEEQPEHIRLPDEQEMQKALQEGAIRDNKQEGVCAAYHGYTTFSNHRGKMSFPRKHSQEDIFLIITRGITPVFSHDETIQYLQITRAKETRMYYLKRVKDTEKNTAHWNVSELSVEERQSIPPSGLIIFARPEHVIVPTGTFDTIPGGTLLLPEIYIKQSMPNSVNSLAFLRINRYFAPVRRTQAYQPNRYATGILP